MNLKEWMAVVDAMPMSQHLRTFVVRKELSAVARKLQKIRKGRAYRSQRKLLRKKQAQLTAEQATLIMSQD